MTTKQTDSLGIPSMVRNLKKVHCVWAGGKMTHLYEAQTDAVNGSPCILTRYTYVTGTSDVEAFVEENSTWNSAWDI